MTAINTIVVSCMDRRLSQYLDQRYNSGSAIFLRNAGANVKTLLNSIKQAAIERHITRFVIAPHTDCGAMGLVEKVLKGETSVSTEVNETLVSQFMGKPFDDRKELEKINAEIQKEAIRPFANSINAEVERDLIDISMVNVPKGEGLHILTITKPTPTKYEALIRRYRGIGMFDSYFIQARSIKDVLPDIEIAVTALHIADVRLLAEGQMQHEQLMRDMQYLKAEPFITGARVSLFKKL